MILQVLKLTLRYWVSLSLMPYSDTELNEIAKDKAAGPIRNKWMLDDAHPDLVVSFYGGRGTANMIKQAREAGVEVFDVYPTHG